MAWTRRQKNKLIYGALMALCIVGFWWFENFHDPKSYEIPGEDHPVTAFPEPWLPAGFGGERVRHAFYQLEYAEAHEQAAWVAYVLDPAQLTRDDRERPYYIEDPEVSTFSADWRNYRGSGYDRGHLCPAGDRRFSLTAYNQTFYTSNVSPQDPGFNAGIWNELEMQVRRWCRRYGRVFVITGGVLGPGLPAIGEEQVTVPAYFYKVVIREGDAGPLAIGFLMPNQPREETLQRFAVSLDSIEGVTGLDFFRELPPSVQEGLESRERSADWHF
ncbi:DNA/RNA non-specific endonuclease [Robiginitalea sp. SC105]|uniref:DNA/RNA non-specific endonuclease n=1 Tax=Robiginitalea sp. SC105 TaxID=2762332 RepID=UPI00163AD028|nr:DNA/RNA non-specific endonuclease [Robiginitalea sp. SC105]MBC2837790.1 DNA/RNA non-specific endonuclease [Robiginitalea sp. SC105]